MTCCPEYLVSFSGETHQKYLISIVNPVNLRHARHNILLQPIYLIHGLEFIKAWGKPLRQDTPALPRLKRVDNQRRMLAAWHHCIVFSHVSWETFSSFPSRSQRCTYSRECTGYASQEPMVDVLAVGAKCSKCFPNSGRECTTYF